MKIRGRKAQDRSAHIKQGFQYCMSENMHISISNEMCVEIKGSGHRSGMGTMCLGVSSDIKVGIVGKNNDGLRVFLLAHLANVHRRLFSTARGSSFDRCAVSTLDFAALWPRVEMSPPEVRCSVVVSVVTLPPSTCFASREKVVFRQGVDANPDRSGEAVSSVDLPAKLMLTTVSIRFLYKTCVDGITKMGPS